MTYPIHARLFVVFLVLTLAFSALARSQGVQPVAVPNDAKRSEAGTLVRDIFEDSYAEAKSVMQRREVITKMITTAKATHDDDAARYELLRVGKDLAIQLGDVDLADQAVQSLGAHFQVDKPQLQLELAQKLGAAGKPRSQREEVVSLLEKYFVQAMAAEEYAGADKYAALGADVSTGLRSPDLERWTQRGKTASSLEERYRTACRQRVERKFCIETMVTHYERVYAEIFQLQVDKQLPRKRP